MAQRIAKEVEQEHQNLLADRAEQSKKKKARIATTPMNSGVDRHMCMKQVQHTASERSVLGRVQHPFVVKLHFAFQTSTRLHFVLDYCPGGDLYYHITRVVAFTEPAMRFYAAEVVLALGHLHSMGIMYRDLKVC